MVLVWLFLLGINTFFDGQFTPIEVAMTIIIGIDCCVGSLAAVRGFRCGGFTAILVFLAGAGLQLLAMWLGFQ